MDRTLGARVVALGTVRPDESDFPVKNEPGHPAPRLRAEDTRDLRRHAHRAAVDGRSPIRPTFCASPQMIATAVALSGVQADRRRPGDQCQDQADPHEPRAQAHMAAVPKAFVVITNPTHEVVALRYERGMDAPVCVAKGVDRIACNIREVAEAHDTPIVENPPLAPSMPPSRSTRRSGPSATRRWPRSSVT